MKEHMKSKANAKQKREADALQRKALWTPEKSAPERGRDVPVPVFPKPVTVKKADLMPQQSPEEETREFLAYLDRYSGPVRKDDTPMPAKRKEKRGTGIVTLNLEDGMPVVSEAVDRMHMGLQEMRVSRAGAVKLIHGYGSTGHGGKICSAVRQELASMKRRKLIRDYISGEDFGPMDDASRKLAERNREITRDPDYGRINHGITIVVL